MITSFVAETKYPEFPEYKVQKLNAQRRSSQFLTDWNISVY